MSAITCSKKNQPTRRGDPMKIDAKFLLNAAAFQLAWFACVLGAAGSMPLAGTLTVCAVVALHLGTVRNPAPEAMLVVALATIGAGWDSLVVTLGLMAYPSGVFADGIAPHWIIAMWANFATTLNVSMRWLRGRPALAVLLGGVGGPLAYYTGFKLGGVDIPGLWPGIAVQAIGWGVMMPLLVQLATRLDGTGAASEHPVHGADMAQRAGSDV